MVEIVTLHITRDCRAAARGPSRAVMIVLLVMTLPIASRPAWGQTNTCGNAVHQLQRYVAQVNNVTQLEIQQGIPMRCQGRPGCADDLVQQLTAWYQQQVIVVQNYQMRLVLMCSPSRAATAAARPRPASEIDEDEIADLEIDDENRAVRIRIPGTPQGFRPR